MRGEPKLRPPPPSTIAETSKAAVVAVAARRTRAPVATIPAVTALTVAIVLLAHLDRRLLVQLFDPHREEADDVGRNPHLALHFDHRLVGRLNVEERVMRAPVLLDPVGCGLETPIFGLADLSANFLNDGFVGVHQPCHLLRRHILARKKSMLI